MFGRRGTSAVRFTTAGDPRAARSGRGDRNACWAATRLGQSYITGYGTDYTRHQRTRHFAHDLDPAFPPTPPGAARRGPDVQELPRLSRRPRLGSLATPMPLP